MLALRQWLESYGLGQHADVLLAQDITLDILPDLTEQDLQSLGLSMGDRKRLLRATQSLRDEIPGLQEAPHAYQPDHASDVAQRRQLTLLFCDLVESTALSLRLDPEELRDVIRSYRDASAAIIEQFGGYTARFLGDGILAYFGYPRAHEDDAECAVRAALALVDAIADLKAPGGLPLQVRIGIATGRVVAGDLIGQGTAVEEAVVGTTPHLAARLQCLAGPGEVVIASSTHALVSGFFTYKDLGQHRLKGFDEPVQAWRVVGLGDAAGRFEALHGRRLTPLVGRLNELGFLLGLWQQAKQSEGQVVLISGESGIGKSRLVQAVRERLRHERYIHLCFQCSRFDTNSPLYPVALGLERLARFGPDDSPEAKLAKLGRLLQVTADRPAELCSLLATLFSIPKDDQDAPSSLSPDLMKEKILDVLVDQLSRLTKRRPVLLVFEDLHWLDPTSRELLDRLIKAMQNLPLLGLFTFRPDFEAGWFGLPHVSGLVLNRLGRRQGAAMVAKLAEAKRLPDILIDQIVTKADGVPLFVEELTKSLLDSGLLVDHGDRYELTSEFLAPAVPSSLEDSLMARLDRLGQAKEVAQIGAVVGREFSYETVASLAEFPSSKLDRALEQLTKAGLVYRQGQPPHATYSFKHALVQDTAYQSLLKSQRQTYHQAIYHRQMAQSPGVEDSHPEFLAYHATEGGLADAAVTHWWRAGRKALRCSAHAEAIAHARRGLDLLQDSTASPQRARQELSLLIVQGQALMATKGYAASDVESTFARAEEIGTQLNDKDALFPILTARRTIHATRGEWLDALRLAEQCTELAAQTGDAKHRLHAHQALGVTRLHLGDLSTALKDLNRSIALYDEGQGRAQPSLQAPKVDCLAFSAWGFWLMGLDDGALERDRMAITAADQLGHPFSQAFAQTLSSALSNFRREAGLQMDAAATARSISDRYGFRWLSACTAILGAAARARIEGDKEVLAEIQEGLDAYQDTGARGQLPYLTWLYADACWACADEDTALAALDRAAKLAEQMAERWWLPEIYRLRGEIEGRSGEPASAISWCDRAMQLAHDQEAKSLKRRAGVSLARLYLKEGRIEQARLLLTSADAGFAEGCRSHDANDAKELLRQAQQPTSATTSP